MSLQVVVVAWLVALGEGLALSMVIDLLFHAVVEHSPDGDADGHGDQDANDDNDENPRVQIVLAIFQRAKVVNH